MCDFLSDVWDQKLVGSEFFWKRDNETPKSEQNMREKGKIMRR